MAKASGGGPGGAPPNLPTQPGGYTVMMSEEDFHNTQSMEMTKFIRDNFKRPKVPPYSLENIKCRNSQTWIKDSDPAKWENRYLRRQNNMMKGFYTPNFRPYHSVGDVQLNMQRLLLNTLSNCLPAKLPLQSLTSRFGRRDQKTVQTKVETSKSPVKEILAKERVDPEIDEKLRERAINTGGYAYIQQRLEESEAVLRAERGGQSFEKCTKKIRDLKKHQSQLHKKQSSLQFNPPPDLGAWSPMTSPTPGGVRPKQRLEDIVDMEMRAHSRRKRLLIGKLRCISKIMNALHNIKTRDIRSRVPMSHDQVKHVYRDVVWDKPAPISELKPAPPSKRSAQQQNVMETTARVHSSADTVSSGELQGYPKNSKPGCPVPAKQSSMSMQGKGTSEAQTSPSPAPWKKFGYHANIRKGFRIERENKIDTWEDLLVASSPGPSQRNSVLPTLITLSQPANIAMRWHQHHIEHKQKQPYWMMQGVASEEKVKRSTQPTNTSKSKSLLAETPDAEVTLERIQQGFKKTQKKLAREALQDLERLERDRQRVIKQKFQVITESPLFEKTLQHLKEARTHHGAPVISIDEDSEIKLSPWYMDLKASVESALGKYDPDVICLFNTLSQFSLEDGKSIPQAKEKLCLLTMSMPASELLTIQMQLAIAFVLEEILWAPPKALSQWLHHRKVPLIIDIDMQDEHA